MSAFGTCASSLHGDARTVGSDRRPFAYVYVVWQDEAHGFHMFRERWVKDRGWWFTRVVGLVPNSPARPLIGLESAAQLVALVPSRPRPYPI